MPDRCLGSRQVIRPDRAPSIRPSVRSRVRETRGVRTPSSFRTVLVLLFASTGCTGRALVSSDAAFDAPADAVDAMIDTGSRVDATDARDAAPDTLWLDPSPSKGPWVQMIDTTHARVRWESRATPASVAITYAPESGGAMQSATGSSRETTVTTGYGVGVSIVPVPDLAGTYAINEVDLAGLSPATCYRYEVTGYPGAGRFCTAHEASDHTTPISFIAIGDTNPVLMHTEGVLQHALPHNPEFTVHLGDMQYYSSVLESWQTWFGMMRPLLAQGAIFPCVGNHENELNDLEYVDYYQRLFTPASSDGNDSRYHYETGGVHFFSLDTQSDLTMGAPQYGWLMNTLDRVEAEPGYRFSVLYFHRPVYTLGDVDPRVDIRTALAPLMTSHRIPLVLSGHMHGYERFVVNGTTYIVSGGGGGAIGDVNAGVASHPSEVPLRQAAGAWFHAVVFTLNGTTMHGETIDERGTVRDTFDFTVP